MQETDELQKCKRMLEEENKKLRREVQLNEQSVKEYAKQVLHTTHDRHPPASLISYIRHVQPPQVSNVTDCLGHDPYQPPLTATTRRHHRHN